MKCMDPAKELKNTNMMPLILHPRMEQSRFYFYFR